MFSPMLLIAGGATIALAVLDKAFESYGYYWFGTALKILLPLAAFAAGIYFIDSNAMIHWLR